MPTCAVFGCSERADKGKTGYAFHKFPNRDKSPKRRKQWIIFCRQDESTLAKNSKICSKHFNESDYDPTQRMKRKLMPNEKLAGLQLKPGVVPSITVEDLAKDEAGNSRAKCYGKKKRKNMISESETSARAGPSLNQSPEADADLNVDDPDPILDEPVVPNESSAENFDVMDESVNESQLVNESFCFVNTDNLDQKYGSAEFKTEDNEPESFQEISGKDFDYFLVSWTCLLQLFEICTFCHEKVTNVTRTVNGTAVIVKSRCNACGAEKNWCSQPMHDKQPEGNILISSALLLSGILFSSFECLCSIIKVPFISDTTFYEIIDKKITPFVKKIWSVERKSNLDALKSSSEPIRIAGDGLLDSPGYSANYCVYSAMDVRSKKIIDFELVEKEQMKGELEGPACEILVNKLVNDEKCDIKLFLSDRHKGVRYFMKTNHPQIAHEFDVWHVSKGLMKKFKKYEKKYPKILLWKPSIINHLWWCAQSCAGDGNLLVERFTSLKYHISNRHEWIEGRVKKKCQHGPLSEAESRKKLWLKEKSEEYRIVKKIIDNKRLRKDLACVRNYVHSNDFESYRNVHLKYVPKNVYFSFEGLYLRSIIAILDHNSSLGKKIIGEELQYSKASETWVNNNWKRNLIKDILAPSKTEEIP